MRIKVGIKVRLVYAESHLEQYFSIQSFYTYFMNERFAFYRHINDFVEKNFYLDLPIKEVSAGKCQFKIAYEIGPHTKRVEPYEIDEYFDFEVPDERNCKNCEYYSGDRKLCDQKREFISSIPEHCGFWSEKDLP